MLVLSRKLGEKVYVDGGICVTVVDIDRGKIRLGFSAPPEVGIFREEMLPPDDPRRGGPLARPGGGGVGS